MPRGVAAERELGARPGHTGSDPRIAGQTPFFSRARARGRQPGRVAITRAMSVSTGTQRIVSVLFADVVGSTAIGERLGPERSKFLFDEIVALIAGEVRRFDGTVAQLTGDGLFALFGAPVGHEDDAERAVRAALAIQTAIAAYGAELRSGYDIDLLGARRRQHRAGRAHRRGRRRRALQRARGHGQHRGAAAGARSRRRHRRRARDGAPGAVLRRARVARGGRAARARAPAARRARDGRARAGPGALRRRGRRTRQRARRARRGLPGDRGRQRRHHLDHRRVGHRQVAARRRGPPALRRSRPLPRGPRRLVRRELPLLARPRSAARLAQHRRRRAGGPRPAGAEGRARRPRRRHRAGVPVPRPAARPAARGGGAGAAARAQPRGHPAPDVRRGRRWSSAASPRSPRCASSSTTCSGPTRSRWSWSRSCSG